ncbi:4-galactosyl-N-acetylglucosaminide 3-alpha-L-fucosyltransferase FUT6 [Taenia solium]|eukprot:TsM_000016500 transcript=TsM_000016500 gene=TsM_000016500
MIPIVLGAFKEDYESTLPPHSYINVDDYKSIRELADYLLYLDKNHTAYAAYFAWKEYGRICCVDSILASDRCNTFVESYLTVVDGHWLGRE